MSSSQVPGRVPPQGVVAPRTEQVDVVGPYDEAAQAVGERPLTRDEVVLIMAVTGPGRGR